MKTIFYLLFNSQKALELLDEQYEDDLYRKSIVIFGLTGFVSFISGFDLLEESKFLIVLLFLVLTICVYVIFGMAYAFVLHRIGKLLKGKASFIEVCSLYAYSLFPLIFLFVMIVLINNWHHFSIDTELANNQIYKRGLFMITSIISIKILIKGLIKFNGYSIFKSILNLLPTIVFTILLWYFVLR
ncbi:Yip1 domain-containing protein [Tenacibaculum sp. MAR_2009_124]|uniref:YIP1 family protein n=1 Tax=Tenacibaculum sp. MAR_2009_124 TaxID=1250059 RepID=UPI0008954B30|nr:YIP1 family protein [Tenacibaculum sp. MAR_2009_124]SEC49539.1 Yip1 domain-containing protein [Tenacibaculum sp. MAR_2009_124]